MCRCSGVMVDNLLLHCFVLFCLFDCLFLFIYLFISKENLFKVIKWSHPSIQEVYNKGPNQSNTQVTSFHQIIYRKNRMTSYDRHPI